MARREIHQLSDEEVALFHEGLIALKQERIFDNYVVTHADVAYKSSEVATLPTDRGVAYHGPALLPWNREYLKRFEANMRGVTDESFELPYWDWTLLFDDRPAWPEHVLGGDGNRDASRDDLGLFDVEDPPFGQGGEGQRRWSVVDANGRASDNLMRHLGGRGPGKETSLPTRRDEREALKERRYDQSPFNRASSGGVRIALERLMIQVHEWVGGTMLTTVAPNDPAFFLIHCNVDRLWHRWQLANPDHWYLPREEPNVDLPEEFKAPRGHAPDDWLYPWRMQVHIQDAVTPEEQRYDHTEDEPAGEE